MLDPKQRITNDELMILTTDEQKKAMNKQAIDTEYRRLYEECPGGTPEDSEKFLLRQIAEIRCRLDGKLFT